MDKNLTRIKADRGTDHMPIGGRRGYGNRRNPPMRGKTAFGWGTPAASEELDAGYLWPAEPEISGEV